MKKYRIFLAIGGKATPVDKSNMWVRNLYDPLVSLGHDVHLLNIDEYVQQQGWGYMTEQAREGLSNELPRLFLKEHNKKPFDIFLSYLHNGQIIPSVLKEIKKEVYTINYSTNYHQFDMYKEVAGIVDCNIYISKVAKEGFDGIGVKSYWMPLGANPTFYKPSSIKNNNAVFVGSAYGPRSYLFWRLLQYGIDLELYGHGWVDYKEKKQQIYKENKLKQAANRLLQSSIRHVLTRKIAEEIYGLEDEVRHKYQQINTAILSLMRRDYDSHLHGSLTDELYVQTLAEAGTVINIQESRFNHDYFDCRVLRCSNLRDYEATMCGSFLCTQYSDEIAELFDVGKEIVCYHNEHDLAEQIKYYNHHITEKEAIAKAGYNRSLQSHTWEKRFSIFFEFLNI